MKNLLLVGNMREARVIPHEGMLIGSVNSLSSLRGLTVNAVYATGLAKSSPHYDEALAYLAICCMTRDTWHGAERVL